MYLSFHGAAGTVTGSCHLLDSGSEKLLVDCGMFQGSSALNSMNFDDFAFEPSEVGFMLLTHAHVDHSGRIPKLVKEGFSGPIYTTKASIELCEIMLADCAYIQQNEAEYKSRKNVRKGLEKAEPLYTQEDVDRAMKLFCNLEYDRIYEIGKSFRVRFNDAGHMLGSAIIEVWVTDTKGKTEKIVFSGDLGNIDKPLLKDPFYIKDADYVVMESTYGSRNHKEKGMGENALLDIIKRTYKRGGNVIIPVFAVGRAQEVLYELNKYKEEALLGEAQDIPVVLDSPMAAKATEIFKKNYDILDEETQDLLRKGDDPLVFENLRVTQSTEESKQLNADLSPKIILSASGMCDAGRIRHHIKHNVYRPECSIVFVGYQAEGSLGRLLLDGRTNIKLFGETINVAAEIDSIDAFSGHADHDGLVNWITGFEGPPKQVILVHGDTESLESLSFSLGSLGINNVIAVYQKTLRVGGAFVDESDATQEMSETRNNVIKRKKERIVPKKVLPVDSSYDKNLYERALEIASALQEKINIEDKDTERIDLYLSSLEDILEK